MIITITTKNCGEKDDEGGGKDEITIIVTTKNNYKVTRDHLTRTL
jgi:hypothetical protein